LAKGAQPSLKYEIKDRNFNDADKSEQCSKITRKLSESNTAAIFPAFFKK